LSVDFRHNRQADSGRFRLLAQDGFEVSAASNHPQNQRIVSFDTIEHEMVTHRECPHAGPKIVTPTAGARVRSEEEKASRYGVDYTVGGLDAAVARDVVPELVEIGFSLGREAMRH